MNRPLLETLGEARPMHTSEARPAFVVRSAHGAHIKLSLSSLDLLRAVEAGQSFEDLAAEVSRTSGIEVTAAEVETAFARLRSEIEAIDLRAEKRSAVPLGFWFRWTLLPARLTARLAAMAAPLFSLPWLVVLAAAIAVAGWVVRTDGAGLAHAEAALPAGYLLFLVSLLVHELGHAAACARFGGAPSDIGFTLYLVYPAFYSDVSAAWFLKRSERVLVDLGGCYFQLLAGGIFGALYLESHWEPLRIALVLILVSCAFSLNPVFKFDGYWVVADALGVTNLGQQPRRIAKALLGRVRGRPVAALPWPLGTTVLLGLYSVVSFAVWAVFLTSLLPILWRSATSPAGEIALLVRLLTGTEQATLAGILSLLTYGFFAIGAALLLLRLSRAAMLQLAAAVRRATRPASRS